MANLTKDDVILALIRAAGFDESVTNIYLDTWTGKTDADALAAQKAAADKALADAQALVTKYNADKAAAQAADKAEADAAAAKAAADAQLAGDTPFVPDPVNPQVF